MKDKINPNLKRLAELTCNPSLELPDLSEKVQEQVPVQTNQLERDANGKPKIKLTPLEEKVVNTPTQESYNTLMQVYECGGWTWASGNLPTQMGYWDSYKEKICIEAINGFSNGPKGSYRNMSVFSAQEFYNKQNITDGMIKEINEYFESRKQNER